MPPRMHADEVDTDAALVRRLLAGQFPQWADLPIERVESAGTDNALYRLGDDLVARLPRIHWAIGQVDRDHEWLPRLAPHLPLTIPTPLVRGEPAEGYPWRWAVHRWIEGRNATSDRLANLEQFATDLARFITVLHAIDATGGPPAGPDNFNRGVPLAQRDATVRTHIDELRTSRDAGFDLDAVSEAWEAALEASVWDGPPVWLHGDLQAGNLLVDDRGDLTPVIDFGCLGVGDPAADLHVAWNLLDAPAREVFRGALNVDDATWSRGRGWAITHIGALTYYRDTNPTLANIARHALSEALADHARGS